MGIHIGTHTHTRIPTDLPATRSQPHTHPHPHPRTRPYGYLISWFPFTYLFSLFSITLSQLVGECDGASRYISTPMHTCHALSPTVTSIAPHHPHPTLLLSHTSHIYAISHHTIHPRTHTAINIPIQPTTPKHNSLNRSFTFSYSTSRHRRVRMCHRRLTFQVQRRHLGHLRQCGNQSLGTISP